VRRLEDHPAAPAAEHALEPVAPAELAARADLPEGVLVVGRRVGRRIAGKGTGRLLGKMFK